MALEATMIASSTTALLLRVAIVTKVLPEEEKAFRQPRDFYRCQFLDKIACRARDVSIITQVLLCTSVLLWVWKR